MSPAKLLLLLLLHAYLKGASATALVVMAMWSEKSFQVDKKRSETPV